MENTKITVCPLTANKTTANGNTYSLEALQALANGFHEDVGQGKHFLGGILSVPDLRAEYGIDLGKVSHEITDLRVEGDSLIAELTILGTQMGKLVKDLFSAGVALPTSICCTGRVVEEDGKKTVREQKFNGVNFFYPFGQKV